MWGAHSSHGEEGEPERARRLLSAVIQAGDGDLGQGQAWLGGKIQGILVTEWMRMRRGKEEWRRAHLTWMVELS